MTTPSKSKIDWKTIFAGLGTSGALLMAILQFNSASSLANDNRIKALETRLCRLEAVESIGDCKR